MQVDDTYPTKDSLRMNYQQSGNKNIKYNQESDYTMSVDNIMDEHLKLPFLKNKIQSVK